MTWVEYPIDEIDPHELIIEDKRFKGQKLILPELLDVHLWMVKEYFKDCKEPLDVINKVIVDVKYPLDAFGNPTDYHKYQAFMYLPKICLFTRVNKDDYWQTTSETIWTKIGDCDDVSHMAGGGLELLGVPYYICYGLVYRGNKLLGGHAWIIFKHGDWYLAECTLDEPYRSYNEMPKINIESNEWRWGNLIYKAFVRWNKRRIGVWMDRKETKTFIEALREALRMYSEIRVMKNRKKYEKKKLQEIAIEIGKKTKGIKKIQKAK